MEDAEGDSKSQLSNISISKRETMQILQKM